jgi:glucose dehydrogenase
MTTYRWILVAQLTSISVMLFGWWISHHGIVHSVGSAFTIVTSLALAMESWLRIRKAKAALDIMEKQ